MDAKKDIEGKRFGRLIAIELVPGNGRSRQKCVCDCGNTIEANRTNLVSGNTKSCGCLRKETSRKNVEKHPFSKKHGKHGTRIYETWANMLSRCRNPKIRSYRDYGSRGIKVCEEWLEFENFYKWALSSGYKENLTIDRIDVNKDYSPENCRWATTKQQARNKRTSVFITYKGETKVLKDWAIEYKIDSSTLKGRISRGWRIEDALTKPVKK